MYPRAHLWFGLVLLIAVAGFTPSYFAVLGSTDAVHHFHGVTATAWMVLLVSQSWLVTRGRLAWHRRLGRLSMGLVPLFLLSGALVMRTMLRSEGPFNALFGRRLAVTDLLTLTAFAAAYTLALVHRKQQGLHARYMATTAILVLPPALARLLPRLIPGLPGFVAAYHLSSLLAELAAAALLLDDWRRERRLRAPYLGLLAVLLLQQLLFWLMSGPR